MAVFQRQHNQPRKPARRLLAGLAGSALIRTDPVLEQFKPTPLPEIKSPADILAEMEANKREKRKLAARERRKLQAVRIREIKDWFAKPIEQRRDEILRERELAHIPSTSAGMSDGSGFGYHTGGFDRVKFAQMEIAAQQGDSRGRGAKSDDTGDNQKKRFHVKLDVDASFRQRVMQHVINKHVDNVGIGIFPLGGDGEDIELPAALCKLCPQAMPDSYVEDHILDVHGDIFAKMSRRLIREDRKLKPARRSDGSLASLEQFYEGQEKSKSDRETEARRQGYVVEGTVYDPERRKHVPNWVKAPAQPAGAPENPVTG